MYNSLQDNSALDWIIINFYLSFITHKFKIKVNNLNSWKSIGNNIGSCSCKGWASLEPSIKAKKRSRLFSPYFDKSHFVWALSRDV